MARTRQLNVRIEPDLYRELIKAANRHRLTYGDIVAYGLRFVIAGLADGTLDPADIARYRIPTPDAPRKRRTGGRVTANNGSTRE